MVLIGFLGRNILSLLCARLHVYDIHIYKLLYTSILVISDNVVVARLLIMLCSQADDNGGGDGIAAQLLSIGLEGSDCKYLRTFHGAWV